MQKNKYCVYNTTRETFLSLGVHAADTALTRLKGLIGRLKLGTDDGLWVVPSRGIHTIGVTFPLDLIYLDADSRIIHIRESFPPFHVAPLITQAASVLQLPTHTVYSSHSQVGDQMLICMANEMENRLTMDPKPASDKNQMTEDEPVRRSAFGRWMKNLFTRDRRRAERLATQNLTAYFWNGSMPEPHQVRDISATGLYLQTDERWCPGTVVKMTLQDNDPNIPVTGQTITVESMAVRSDEDGTGLKFVLPDVVDERHTPNALLDGAGRNALNQFLERFHNE